MAKTKDFGIGLMHEVAVAAAKHGWSPDELSSLCKHPELMFQVRGVLLGTHLIDRVECIIDADALPFIPEGCTIECHTKNGMYNWWQNIPTTSLPGQTKSSYDAYFGHFMAEWRLTRYSSEIILNATILDTLIVSQYLIPNIWKNYSYCKKGVAFYGTVYLDPNGDRFVRGVVFEKGFGYSEIRIPLVDKPGDVYPGIIYVPKD